MCGHRVQIADRALTELSKAIEIDLKFTQRIATSQFDDQPNGSNKIIE